MEKKGLKAIGTRIMTGDFFRTNVREYMDSLDQEKRDAMIRIERKVNPGCCCECIFYRNVTDRNGSLICGECAIDEDIMITDSLQRQLYCPL